MAATQTAPARCDTTLTGWPALTQLLGHTDTWPETWHHTLAHHGPKALLTQAAHDLAPTEETT